MREALAPPGGFIRFRVCFLYPNVHAPNVEKLSQDSNYFLEEKSPTRMLGTTNPSVRFSTVRLNQLLSCTFLPKLPQHGPFRLVVKNGEYACPDGNTRRSLRFEEVCAVYT